MGTGTLWGSLARAFGPAELNSAIGRAATGGLVLAIYALDEAEMHAGGEAFDAFLVEIRDMFAAPRPIPGAVIGRTETIDYVEMFLGSVVSRYRISTSIASLPTVLLTNVWIQGIFQTRPLRQARSINMKNFTKMLDSGFSSFLSIV